MISKLTSHLKKPATYVILAIGALLALAYSSRLNVLKSAASKLPGADA